MLWKMFVFGLIGEAIALVVGCMKQQVSDFVVAKNINPFEFCRRAFSSRYLGNGPCHRQTPQIVPPSCTLPILILLHKNVVQVGTQQRMYNIQFGFTRCVRWLSKVVRFVIVVTVVCSFQNKTPQTGWKRCPAIVALCQAPSVSSIGIGNASQLFQYLFRSSTDRCKGVKLTSFNAPVLCQRLDKGKCSIRSTLQKRINRQVKAFQHLDVWQLLLQNLNVRSRYLVQTKSQVLQRRMTRQ